MRKILYFVLMILFSLAINGSAQTGTISGIITDSANGNPLYNAGIFVKGSTIRTSADKTGNYALKLKPGTYSIEIINIGFVSRTINDIRVEADSTIVLDVLLNATAEKIVTEVIEEVEISEQRVVSIRCSMSSVKVTHVSARKRSKRGRWIKGNYSPNFSSSDFNTEAYTHNPENDFRKVADEPLSTFSIDVDKASYSNMRRFVTDGQLPPIDAVRSEEMINYFTYDYPEPEGEHPFSVSTEVAACPWNADNKLVHVGLKAQSIVMDETINSNLVFLLDVSGSMASPDKLPLVVKSIDLLVDNLKDNDRIAIVVYAGAAGVVLPSTKAKYKDKIMATLKQLEAGGSTAGGEGIKMAYQIAAQNFLIDGNNRVILATDGDFNVGVSSESELVRLIEKERTKGIFLTVLGFGTGNYKDSRMEALADKGNGNYAYIDNILEAKKVLVNEMGGTLYTVAKDVKFQLEFNPAEVESYRLIGYENRLLENKDFNDDTKDAGEMGMGHTVTALYEIVPAGMNLNLNSKGKVDPLKYQNTQVNETGLSSGELLTIKLRYKKPDERKSIMFSQVVLDKRLTAEAASNNLRWAASVAQFGMLLRNSKYSGTTSYTNTISLAKSAKGIDDKGYRAECIRLMEMAELLSKKQESSKNSTER